MQSQFRLIVSLYQQLLAAIKAQRNPCCSDNSDRQKKVLEEHIFLTFFNVKNWGWDLKILTDAKVFPIKAQML